MSLFGSGNDGRDVVEELGERCREDAREGMDGVENDRVARVAMYDFDLDMAGL